jgi:hypothetical protein
LNQLAHISKTKKMQTNIPKQSTAFSSIIGQFQKSKQEIEQKFPDYPFKHFSAYLNALLRDCCWYTYQVGAQYTIEPNPF